MYLPEEFKKLSTMELIKMGYKKTPLYLFLLLTIAPLIAYYFIVIFGLPHLITPNMITFVKLPLVLIACLISYNGLKSIYRTGQGAYFFLFISVIAKNHNITMKESLEVMNKATEHLPDQFTYPEAYKKAIELKLLTKPFEKCNT